MSIITTDSVHYTNMANAVRAINGTNNQYTPSQITSEFNVAKNEIDNQTDIIEQIETALNGKGAGGGVAKIAHGEIDYPATMDELGMDGLPNIAELPIHHNLGSIPNVFLCVSYPTGVFVNNPHPYRFIYWNVDDVECTYFTSNGNKREVVATITEETLTITPTESTLYISGGGNVWKWFAATI